MTIVNGAGTNGTVDFLKRGRGRSPRELPPTKPTSYFRRKRLFDRIVATLLLVPGLPIMGLLILLVRLTSRGPGIFRQQRVGKGGETFTMLKLRSMRIDAEHRSGAVWAKENDPRITPIGKWLRRLHLDELPQLFNVLTGHMSLIGPRPERPEFVDVLAAALPGYEDRHLVPPGVTGLAQINLPPDSDLNSVAQKLALDLEYIETGSLWLDIRLLLCTLGRVVKVGGSLWPRVFGTRRDLKGHTKYIVPDVAQVCPRGGTFSANELATKLADAFGDTVDGQLMAELEETIADAPCFHAPGGNGNDPTTHRPR